MKKLSKMAGNPAVQYAGGGIAVVAAVGGLKILVERYPFLKDAFTTALDDVEKALAGYREEYSPEIDIRG